MEYFQKTHNRVCVCVCVCVRACVIVWSVTLYKKWNEAGNKTTRLYKKPVYNMEYANHPKY